MAIKDKVLELLDDNKGKYLSGEQLADTLGCTRGAVWKAVKALQENVLCLKKTSTSVVQRYRQ